METVGAEVTSFLPAHLADTALFDDRADAGRRLALALHDDLHEPVVVGTTGGGVEIGAEVAAHLHAPLDIVAVAPVRRTPDHEYAVGAVAPGDALYLREGEQLSPAQSVVAVARAHREAAHVDSLFHDGHRRPALAGRDLVLVDEAITTGATMAAAVAWGRHQDVARILAAVPVGAAAGLAVVRALVDELVCLYEFEVIGARAVWFGDFPRLADDDVRRLLEATQ
jgi:putative phosphoribosyl transferase